MENETLIENGLRTELSALYRAPDRHYHGLRHIESLLAFAGEYRAELADPAAVEAAIWFHDAIYDSRAADNETRSAILASEKLGAQVSPERLARIVAMIEATATHTVPDIADPKRRRDAALFLDMDIAILGAPPPIFDEYERAVREEYAWVEEAAWRAGRSAVLKKFLARDRIFHTPEFHDRFEAQARANMERSLRALDGKAG